MCHQLSVDCGRDIMYLDHIGTPTTTCMMVDMAHTYVQK